MGKWVRIFFFGGAGGRFSERRRSVGRPPALAGVETGQGFGRFVVPARTYPALQMSSLLRRCQAIIGCQSFPA